jgi:hypothetical protein
VIIVDAMVVVRPVPIDRHRQLGKIGLVLCIHTASTRDGKHVCLSTLGRYFSKGDFFPNLYRRRKACKWDARPDLHGDGDAAGRRGGRSHHSSRQGAGGTPAVMLGHDRPHMSSSRRRAYGDFSCAVQLKAVAWVTGEGRAFEIKDDLLRRPRVRHHEQVDQKPLDSHGVVTDLVIARRLQSAQLQAG